VQRFVLRAVTWLLALLRREHFVIGRAEALEDGRGEVPYLERWTLLGRRFEGSQRLFLHCFHRSDRDDLHNHPWAFWSLILWGGYFEKTPEGRRWYRPLSLLRRPATWRHAVEIPEGRLVWTLVWAGPKVQSWGFFCDDGKGNTTFRPWREHARREAAGLTGCGPEETT
jgi:hypothetical protein